MGLLDLARRLGPAVPAVDEVKLRNLVGARVGNWRHEPGGVPRQLPDVDIIFIARKLGRVVETWPGGALKRADVTDAELATIRRLWSEERERIGRGGAHGTTTHDYEPSSDAWARFDADYRRLWR